MALFDKLGDIKNKVVETASVASTVARESMDKAKAEHEQRMAEQKALEEEMIAKASAMAQEIMNGILEYSDGSKGGFFANISEEELLKYTKDFYEKLLLPGGKTSSSCVNMHPYMDDKQIKKFVKNFSQYDISEKPLLYIHDGEKQELLLTTKTIYFRKPLPENKKYFADGAVAVENIDLFSLEDVGDGYYSFKCDTYELAKIKLINAYKQDFISLNEYFKCVKAHDLEIANEKIDQLIQMKIGTKIYNDVKKYMAYEDELILFYAGGLDSLSAVDYVACTTQQVIIVDREMLGATANVRQYYYEDITSMATIQNANSGDLLVDLIDTALTASFKLCDLDITVAGSHNKISTLNTIEAQRVIAIYHERRKLAKEEARQPQVIQNVEKAPDITEQLQKLAGLKDAGIISEDEFNTKKAELLERL